MRYLTLLTALAISTFGLVPQSRAQDADPYLASYVVSYVEVLPGAKDAAATMLRDYGAASRKEDGNLRFDVLQRHDRPNHFAIVEAWRDQKTADAHRQAAATTQFRDKLQKILAAGYDERPHAALAVGGMQAGTPLPRDALYAVTHVDFIPPKKDDGTAALKQLSEPSRKDDGNLRYEVLVQASRPNHLTVVEVWRNRAALDAHDAAGHTVRFRMDTLPMSGALYDQRIYGVL
jgi:quinol monooxygenase YgiN